MTLKTVVISKFSRAKGCSVAVLLLVRIELFFFTAAVHLGFVLETADSTELFSSLLGSVYTELRPFVFLNPSHQQRGCAGVHPSCPTGHCRQYGAVLGKEEGREECLDGVFVLLSHHYMELCFPGMAEHLPALGRDGWAPCVGLLECVTFALPIKLSCLYLNPGVFSLFPFLILSPVPLAGASGCMGMSFCLGLNHNSCSQLGKASAEVSAGL